MVVKTFGFITFLLGSLLSNQSLGKETEVNLKKLLSNKNKEVVCMAQVIYDEARGESYKGKIAIASVVMNRVKHKKFPNSVCKTVYQKRGNACQFSGMCKKSFKKVDEQSLKLAYNVVVLKQYQDPTKGATHFHNLSVTPYWSKIYEKTSRIGNHVFYRS